MRAFFDTNVLIAALLTKGVCFQLVRHVTAMEIEGILSPQVIQEFERVARTRLHAPEAEIKRTLDELRKSFGMTAPPDTFEKVCRDPDDDTILAAAVAAKAEILVTGDQDLLDLGGRGDVEIIGPAELLRRIGPRRSA